MVSPVTVNVNEVLLQSLISKSELLNDSDTCSILRSDVYLDSMDADGVEHVVHGEGYGGWSDASAGNFWSNPVANHAGGNRTMQNIGHIQLANDLPLMQNHKGNTFAAFELPK